jgi:hypothetical protein
VSDYIIHYSPLQGENFQDNTSINEHEHEHEGNNKVIRVWSIISNDCAQYLLIQHFNFKVAGEKSE